MTHPQPQNQNLTLADIIRTRVPHENPLPITLTPDLKLILIQKSPYVFCLTKEKMLPSADECAKATSAIHEVLGHEDTRQFDCTFNGNGLSMISEPPTFTHQRGDIA